MSELYIGQIWIGKNNKKRTITDLRIEGCDPDDPYDMGSFEEWVVYYKMKVYSSFCEEYKFHDWIKKNHAILFYEPKEKKGFLNVNS